MEENGAVFIPPRQVLATQPIGEIIPPPPDVTRLAHKDWVIEITGDRVVVKCAGAVTSSMRTGHLGQVEVRRDPPVGSNSKATEMVK